MKIELETLGEKEEFVLSEIQMILNLHIAMQTNKLKEEMSSYDTTSNSTSVYEQAEYVINNGNTMLEYHSLLKSIVKSMRIVE